MIAETLDLYALDNDGAERRQIDARVRESGGLDVGDLSR
jgi:hypothetical protein